jgi:hypothetical protein
MDEFYQAKLEELLREFTYYLVEHPEFSENIPDHAQVVLLDQRDPQYSRHAIENAQRARLTDDVPDRPIAYIAVDELAPVRSRLRGLRVLEAPPVYVTA